MPKVSVIMPSLNVVPYIRECMDSVVNQTLRDLEIICVDAGSTDGTWEILREYAQIDDRIRLLRSKKKSYGYQMNLGLKEAEGEYIGIVETDDYILPEMYEKLYFFAVEHDADFVKSDFDIFTTLPAGERLFFQYPINVQYDTLITAQDYVYSGRIVDTFIWNGIYKRTFLNSNQIWFQETPGAAFQDCGFRYQVALSVQRGFFLKRSYYRYRRDNTNSSMYNSKCVLFNLSECKYILDIARRRGWTDKVRMRFLAYNIVQLALGPYMDMLLWGKPSDETVEALAAFRNMTKDFIDQGLLDPLYISADTWLLIKMFVENPAFFEYYVNLKASLDLETSKKFLTSAAQEEQIILFGCGQIGTAAYVTLRNSGLQNVVAYCDNDASKWESKHMDCPVLSPGAAVEQFPDAHFIITNKAHQADIQRQLLNLGVSCERITAYNLNSSPTFCTSISLRLFR